MVSQCQLCTARLPGGKPSSRRWVWYGANCQSLSRRLPKLQVRTGCRSVLWKSTKHYAGLAVSIWQFLSIMFALLSQHSCTDSKPCFPDVLPCPAVLCCAVLCCAVLCCAVLCSAMLCCAAWRALSCSECLLVFAELTADQLASTSGMKRKRTTGKGRGCWKQPWQISSLFLDTEALLTALQTGLLSFTCILCMPSNEQSLHILHVCLLHVACALATYQTAHIRLQ